MADLNKLRQAIDHVDQQLLTLLNERAGLAQEVGHLKQAEGSAVFRPEREAEVIRRLQQSPELKLQPASVGHIWREIMSACRALEAKQRVAYLGPEGTFSQEAALTFFGSSIEEVPCTSLDEVFRLTASGGADFGMVPLENSPARSTCCSPPRRIWWVKSVWRCSTTSCGNATTCKRLRWCWPIRRRWRSVSNGLPNTCRTPSGAP